MKRRGGNNRQKIFREDADYAQHLDCARCIERNPLQAGLVTDLALFLLNGAGVKE